MKLMGLKKSLVNYALLTSVAAVCLPFNVTENREKRTKNYFIQFNEHTSSYTARNEFAIYHAVFCRTRRPETRFQENMYAWH